MPPAIIYTVGHSTRTSQEFLTLLTSFGIKLLVDVRHYPASRKFPQFNKNELEASSKSAGVDYCHEVDLGGRRVAAPDSPHVVWKHPAFRGYADYMQSEAFKMAMHRLKELALKRSTAIMCSESVWWRCHRSLIADSLKAEGWKVLHIMSESKVTEHPYTAPAKVVDGKLFY